MASRYKPLDQINPRKETPAEAFARAEFEALEKRCPVPRCNAQPGEPCVNLQTMKPYLGHRWHRARHPYDTV